MAFLNTDSGHKKQFDTTVKIIETDTHGSYDNKITFGNDLIYYKGGASSANKKTIVKDGEVEMTFKGTDENPYYILENVQGIGSYEIPEGTKIIKRLGAGWNNSNTKCKILIPDSVIYIDRVDPYLLDGIITINNIKYYPSKSNPCFIAIGTIQNSKNNYCLDPRTVLIANDVLNQEGWQDIYIPDSVLHIGDCNLSCNSIRFSENLITLGNFKTTTLTEVKFPNSLQYISNFDFTGGANAIINEITMSSKLYNNISWLEAFSVVVQNSNSLNIHLEGTEKPISRPVSLWRIINIYWNGKELKNTLYHNIVELSSVTYNENKDKDNGVWALTLLWILYLRDVSLFNESEIRWEANNLELLKNFFSKLKNSYDELKNQGLISTDQKMRIYIDKNVELTPEQVDYLLDTYTFIDYIKWENARYIPSLQSAIQHISKTGEKYQFIYDGLKYESVKFYDDSSEIRIKEVVDQKDFYNIYPNTTIHEIAIWNYENHPSELSDNLTLNFATEEDWWKLRTSDDEYWNLSAKSFTVLINNKRITKFKIPDTITTLIPNTHMDILVKNMEEVIIPESVTSMQCFITGAFDKIDFLGCDFYLKKVTAPIQLFFDEGQYLYSEGPLFNKIEELTLTGNGTAKSLWNFAEKSGHMPLIRLKKLYFTGENIDFGDFGGELLSLRELYLSQGSYNSLPVYLYGLWPFKESSESKIKLYFDNQQCSNYICNNENFEMTRILLISNVLDLETITFGDKVDSGFDDLDFTSEHFTEFLFDVDDIDVKNSSVYSTDGNGIVYISKNNKKYPMFAHPIKKDNISQLFITNNRTFWMESGGPVTKPTQLNIFFTGDSIEPHLFSTFNLPNINTIKICDSELNAKEHYVMTEKNTNNNLLDFTNSPDPSCYIHLENSEGLYWNYYTIEDKTVYFQKDKITALWYVAQNADWKDNTYVLPTGVTHIAEGAFSNNRSIKTLVIHKNITTLASYFLQNTNIENVYLQAESAVTWKPLLDSSEVHYFNAISLRQQFNNEASSLDDVIIEQKPITFYVPSISIKETMENDPIWKKLLDPESKIITIEVGVYTSTN